MKVVTVVGARPQFIKAAVVSRAINEWNATGASHRIEEQILHTGQHYDANMSDVFFSELDIPRPVANLGVSGKSHGAATGEMIARIEAYLLQSTPDVVLVYGDTNSTLAAALAAAKLHIPVAHVEAGLRSFNKRMPEEVNRILTDHVSSVLYCPTETAVRNSLGEGLDKNVVNVGDVMYDASLYYVGRSANCERAPKEKQLVNRQYVLATCHREENTDDRQRLFEILDGLNRISARTRVVFPIHPRTQKQIDAFGYSSDLSNIEFIAPVSYLEMIALEANSFAIVTDSGGVQKEAYFFHVPCLTIRDETEWVETVDVGKNVLVGADSDLMVSKFEEIQNHDEWPALFGDGNAGVKIVEDLVRRFGN